MMRRSPSPSEPHHARRAFLLYYAGVLTSEARARAGSAFAESLLQWAAKARREADGLAPAPVQLDMFAPSEACS